MALVIRMTRMGNNKKPFFRVVVAEAQSKINGRYLANVGWYDPKLKKNNVLLKLDQIEKWIARGAKMSASVAAMVRKARRAAKAEPAAAT